MVFCEYSQRNRLRCCVVLSSSIVALLCGHSVNIVEAVAHVLLTLIVVIIVVVIMTFPEIRLHQ